MWRYSVIAWCMVCGMAGNGFASTPPYPICNMDVNKDSVEVGKKFEAHLACQNSGDDFGGHLTMTCSFEPLKSAGPVVDTSWDGPGSGDIYVSGDTIWCSNDKQCAADYLMVEGEDPGVIDGGDFWYTDTYDLKVEIKAPAGIKKIKVLCRAAICEEDWEKSKPCSRWPFSGTTDQQGWLAEKMVVEIEGGSSDASSDSGDSAYEFHATVGCVGEKRMWFDSNGVSNDLVDDCAAYSVSASTFSCEGNKVVKVWNEAVGYCSPTACGSTIKYTSEVIQTCTAYEGPWWPPVCEGKKVVQAHDVSYGVCDDGICLSGAETKVVSTCSYQCASGACVSNPKAYKACKGNEVWWYNDTGDTTEFVKDCNGVDEGPTQYSCNGNKIVATTPVSIEVCNNDSCLSKTSEPTVSVLQECAATSVTTYGAPYCDGKSVKQLITSTAESCKKGACVTNTTTSYSVKQCPDICLNGACHLSPCKVTNAHWSSSTAIDGDEVKMVIEVAGNCSGKEGTLAVIREEKCAFSYGELTGMSLLLKTAAVPWTAVYYTDDYLPAAHYYFRISVEQQPPVYSDVLTVAPKTKELGTIAELLKASPVDIFTGELKACFNPTMWEVDLTAANLEEAMGFGEECVTAWLALGWTIKESAEENNAIQEILGAGDELAIAIVSETLTCGAGFVICGISFLVTSYLKQPVGAVACPWSLGFVAYICEGGAIDDAASVLAKFFRMLRLGKVKDWLTLQTKYLKEYISPRGMVVEAEKGAGKMYQLFTYKTGTPGFTPVSREVPVVGGFFLSKTGVRKFVEFAYDRGITAPNVPSLSPTGTEKLHNLAKNGELQDAIDRAVQVGKKLQASYKMKSIAFSEVDGFYGASDPEKGVIELGLNVPDTPFEGAAISSTVWATIGHEALHEALYQKVTLLKGVFLATAHNNPALEYFTDRSYQFLLGVGQQEALKKFKATSLFELKQHYKDNSDQLFTTFMLTPKSDPLHWELPRVRALADAFDATAFKSEIDAAADDYLVKTSLLADADELTGDFSKFFTEVTKPIPEKDFWNVGEKYLIFDDGYGSGTPKMTDSGEDGVAMEQEASASSEGSARTDETKPESPAAVQIPLEDEGSVELVTILGDMHVVVSGCKGRVNQLISLKDEESIASCYIDFGDGTKVPCEVEQAQGYYYEIGGSHVYSTNGTHAVALQVITTDGDIHVALGAMETYGCIDSTVPTSEAVGSALDAPLPIGAPKVLRSGCTVKVVALATHPCRPEFSHEVEDWTWRTELQSANLYTCVIEFTAYVSGEVVLYGQTKDYWSVALATIPFDVPEHCLEDCEAGCLFSECEENSPVRKNSVSPLALLGGLAFLWFALRRKKAL